MGCFAPDQPPAQNYGQQTSAALGAQVSLAPALYSAEAQTSPGYVDLTASNLQRLLQGTPGGETVNTYGVTTAARNGYYDAAGNFLQTSVANLPPGATYHAKKDQFSAVTGQRVTDPTTGLLDILQQAGGSQRAADINDVATLGPQAREAILAANPDQAALLSRLNQQAVAGLDAGSGLTPEEQRAMQQASRAAFAARGTSGTNGALADELLKQFDLGQQLLRQRQGFAGNVLGYNQAVVGDPFQQILGRPSTAAVQGQGMIPGNLFNPESSYYGNLANSNQQMNALFAEPSTMAKVGQISNTAGQFIGAIGSAFV